MPHGQGDRFAVPKGLEWVAGGFFSISGARVVRSPEGTGVGGRRLQPPERGAPTAQSRRDGRSLHGRVAPQVSAVPSGLLYLWRTSPAAYAAGNQLRSLWEQDLVQCPTDKGTGSQSRRDWRGWPAASAAGARRTEGPVPKGRQKPSRTRHAPGVCRPFGTSLSLAHESGGLRRRQPTALPVGARPSTMPHGQGDRFAVPKGLAWVAGGFSRRSAAHRRPSPEGTAEAFTDASRPRCLPSLRDFSIFGAGVRRLKPPATNCAPSGSKT